MLTVLFFKTAFFLGGLTSFFLGIFIVLQNKKSVVNKTYLGLSIGSAIWSFGFLGLLASTSRENATLWRWFMESGSILIPAFWFHFVYSFLNLNIQSKKSIRLVYMGSIFLWLLNGSDLLSKGIFTKELVPKFFFPYYPSAGIGYYIYFIFFFSTVTLTIYQLYLCSQKKTELAEQAKYLIFGALFGFGGGGMTFLLTLNINLVPYGVVFFAFYPIIVAYAITKQHLFNIKVIATKLLIYGLWIFILTRILIETNFQEQLINSGLLFVTIFIGVLLIKSVLREVETRERIEKLAKELQIANDHLKDLDRQKSEFLSIASHQLRSPITALKGYSSMVLEGSYGEIGMKVREAVGKIFESSARLATVVEEFLNVTRIELGTLKYDFVPTDFKEMIKGVIDEEMPTVTAHKLSIHFEVDGTGSTKVSADNVKLRQVVTNLIDNAIKYTPEGSIAIRLTLGLPGNRLRFSVHDSGIGIPKESMVHMFEKFSRAQNAIHRDTAGSGLGLYVAKEIMKAHKGTIWAESEGEGKGSTFLVELESI